MNKNTCLLIIISLLILLAYPLQADVKNYSMVLRAHPQAIVADGHSSTNISAEVYDSSGKPVADGTNVDFTTSLGTIDRNASTEGGVARVRLESANTIGTANISAVVTSGNAVAQLRVDFLAPGTEIFNESFITVESNSYLGYDTEHKLVDSAGGVKIYHRGLRIDAYECQIDASKNILRAKGKMDGSNIILARGDKKVEASALCYNFNSMQGEIITPVEDGCKRLKIRGRDLYTEPESEADKPLNFEFQPVADSKMFIQAKSLIINPGEEVKIKRAKFYMDGDKILSVPLHVVPLAGHSTGLDKMVAYGSGGIILDFPFYYSLTPNGTGSVRLKHDESEGWGYNSGTSAWETDLEQDYNYNGSTQGRFGIDRFTSSNWGMNWNQTMQFANDSQIYSYVDFADHQNLYSTVDYRRPLKNYTLSMNFDGRNLTSSDRTQYTRVYLQSRAKPIFGGAVNYSYNTRLSYGGYSKIQNNGFGSGFGLQFYGKPIQFDTTSSMNTSLNFSQNCGSGNSGSTIYANANYFKTLGQLGSYSLSYNYSFANSNSIYSDQSVSADISLNPLKQIISHFYLTYGLTARSTSAFGDMSYKFLPTWRLHLLANYQKFSGYSYFDAEYALGKVIGSQEARLIWSQSLQRFRVEFSALTY